jgi:hypothetical protein
MRTQCVLKGICTADEFDEFKEDIYYDFLKDNNFAELKEAELTRERLSLLGSVDPYVGRYYSMAWIQRNVLHLTDDEIKAMEKEIEKEKEEGKILNPQDLAAQAQQDLMDPGGAGGGGSAPAAPAPLPASDSGSDSVSSSSQTKGDLSLNNEYTPAMRMLSRVL